VHLHLSRLSSVFRREDFLRIATENFAATVCGFDGQVFGLHNGDLFFIARDATPTMLQVPVAKLQMLFAQDPLLQREVPEETGRDADGFCTVYNLETDYNALLEDSRKMLRKADEARLASAQHKAKLVEPVKPELLGRLEQALNKVDVSAVVRRQTVCTLIETQPPQPLFDETYISIEDLQDIATPGTDLGSNVWLFRYLTQTLDQRMMTMLIRDGIGATGRPFSINLNVASILSTTFPKFEAAIAPQLRGRLVIEMNKLDVFSDMNAFVFARDYLRDHGFRLCLDGLTHQTIPFYDREKLGFDLVKLYWTPNSLDTMLDAGVPALRSVVREIGIAHTILCRCEDETALTVGRDLGIVMFQGRQVDKMLKEPPPPPPPRPEIRYR